MPGTVVELVGVAPLGDPLELLVRGCSLSIRKGEALWISVRCDASAAAAPEGAVARPVGAACPSTAACRGCR